jgi:hypothetical protein
VLAVVAVNALVAVAAGGRTGSVVALGVVAVPVAVAVIRRPQRAVLLFAALAPFDGLLLVVDLPGVVQGWKEALVLLALAGALGHRRDEVPPLPRWWPAAGGLLVVGLLSAARMRNLDAAVGLKVTFFAMLIGVVAWLAPLDERERDRLVSILMATGVVTALVGIGQQVMGASRLHDLGYRYNQTIRFSGTVLRSFSTFTQPFPFAFFLMLVLLVGIPVALGDPTRARNRAFLVLLPLLGLGLVFSIVRAAWLGLAAGLAYLGVHRHPVLLSGLALAVVAVLLVPANPSNALSARSAEQRSASWQANVPLVARHPLGVGIGTTGSAAGKVASVRSGTAEYQQTGLDGEGAYQPDNQYVKTALELGIPGLWFLGLLLVALVVENRRNAAVLGGEDPELALGVAAFAVAVMVASVFATFLEVFPLDYLLWTLTGVVAVTAASARDASGRADAPQPTS